MTIGEVTGDLVGNDGKDRYILGLGGTVQITTRRSLPKMLIIQIQYVKKRGKGHLKRGKP